MQCSLLQAARKIPFLVRQDHWLHCCWTNFTNKSKNKIIGRFKASSVQGLWCLFFLSDLGPVPIPEMLQEREAVDGQRACCLKTWPYLGKHPLHIGCSRCQPKIGLWRICLYCQFLGHIRNSAIKVSLIITISLIVLPTQSSWQSSSVVTTTKNVCME